MTKRCYKGTLSTWKGGMNYFTNGVTRDKVMTSMEDKNRLRKGNKHTWLWSRKRGHRRIPCHGNIGRNRKRDSGYKEKKSCRLAFNHWDKCLERINKNEQRFILVHGFRDFSLSWLELINIGLITKAYMIDG